MTKKLAIGCVWQSRLHKVMLHSSAGLKKLTMGTGYGVVIVTAVEQQPAGTR